MSVSIFQNLPDAEALIGMDTRFLAGYVLEHLQSQGGNLLSQGNSLPHNLANSISSHYRPKSERVYKAIMAACQWLLNRDFLVPINDQGFFEISKDGSNIKTASDLDRFLEGKGDRGDSNRRLASALEVSSDGHSEGGRRTQEPMAREPEARASLSQFELNEPDKVTFSWLYHHVPVRIAGLFGSFVIAFFIGGVTLGQTTFVRELFGKEQKTLPPIVLSEDLRSRVDQLIEGHNESIKGLYSAIANEEREAGRVYSSNEQQPHIDAGDRLKATLKQENERFEQQLRALRELQK